MQILHILSAPRSPVNGIFNQDIDYFDQCITHRFSTLNSNKTKPQHHFETKSA